MTSDMTRRRLFQLAGITAAASAGAVSLSSCKADPAAAGRDGTFVYAYDFDITAQNYNAIVPDTALLFAAPITELVYPRCALRNWENDDWHYMLAEDAQWQDEVLVITPRSGLKWSDDSDVTIDDFLGSFAERKLNIAPGVDGWPQVKKLDEKDGKIAVTFDEAFLGLEYEILRTRIHPSSRYGEQFDTARTLVEDGVEFDDKEQQEFLNELGELSFDDFISCGPFKIDADKVSDTRIPMSPHADGLFADEVGFDNVTVEKASNDEAAQLVSEHKVDYITHVLGPAERQQFENTEGLQEFSFDDQQGIGLMLNNKAKPEFADVRVRRALMHITDKKEVGKIALGDGGFYVPKYMAGLSDEQAEQVVDSTVLSELDAYEYDPDKASAYLEDAGWTKDGDNWLTAEGEQAEYEILAVNGWNDFDATAQQVAEQWNAFGIKATTKNAEEASIWGIWPAGDYEVAVRQWGNPNTPALHGAWQFSWFSSDNNRTDDEPGMWLDPGEVTSDTYPDADIAALWETSRTSQDEDAANDAHSQLAVIFNETLPRLPIMGFVRLSYGIEGVGVEKFTVDSSLTKNDIYRDNPVMMSILAGKTKSM